MHVVHITIVGLASSRSGKSEENDDNDPLVTSITYGVPKELDVKLFFVFFCIVLLCLFYTCGCTIL